MIYENDSHATAIPGVTMYTGYALFLVIPDPENPKIAYKTFKSTSLQRSAPRISTPLINFARLTGCHPQINKSGVDKEVQRILQLTYLQYR